MPSKAIAIAAMAAIMAACDQPSKPSTSRPEHVIASSADAEGKDINKSPWRITVDADEMTGKKMTFIVTKSLNSHDLHPPYGSDVSATLMVRKHPRYGTDVIVSIGSGQLLCASHDRCAISVRFDEDKLQTYSGGGPTSLDRKILFIEDHQRFIKRLKKSSSVKIELPLYIDGVKIYTFDTRQYPQ